MVDRKPLARRFYEILSRSVYTLVVWLIALIVAISLEDNKQGLSQHSYTWFILTLPLYCLVMFGCYALINIGYHMITISDCLEAQEEVFRQVKEARQFLSSKGMKFD